MPRPSPAAVDAPERGGGLPPVLPTLPSAAAAPIPVLSGGGGLVHGQLLDLLRESKEEFSWMARHAETCLRHAEQRQRGLEVALKQLVQVPPGCEGGLHSLPLRATSPTSQEKSRWSSAMNELRDLRDGGFGPSNLVGSASLGGSFSPTASFNKAGRLTGSFGKAGAQQQPGREAGREPSEEKKEVSEAPGGAKSLSKEDTKSDEDSNKKTSFLPNMTAVESMVKVAKRVTASPETGTLISGKLNRDQRTRQRWLTRLTRSRSFDISVGMLILCNAVFMGLQVDYGNSEEHAPTFLAGSAAFTGLFVVELCLRFLGEGRHFWMRERAWNVLDTVVTICSLVELLIRMSLSDREGSPGNMAILRTLRMLRFVRVARVLRVMHFFRELRLMVFSIIHSMQSIFWALVLLFVTTFMFGISVAQGVKDAQAAFFPDEVVSKLQMHFGSVNRTMLTLFQAVLGGFSWAELSDRLREVGWMYELLFCSFVAFTVLALLNVVTGVFVDGALRSAAQDRDIVIQDQISAESGCAQELRRLFDEADADESGSLTLEEFLHYLKDDRVQSYLRALGIDTAEAEGLFHLLDLDDSGSVETEEFITGCLRFKGQAKGVDVLTLMYENKRMVLAIINALESIAEDIKSMRKAAQCQAHHCATRRHSSARVSVGGLYKRINDGLIGMSRRHPRSSVASLAEEVVSASPPHSPARGSRDQSLVSRFSGSSNGPSDRQSYQLA